MVRSEAVGCGSTVGITRSLGLLTQLLLIVILVK